MAARTFSSSASLSASPSPCCSAYCRRTAAAWLCASRIASCLRTGIADAPAAGLVAACLRDDALGLVALDPVRRGQTSGPERRGSATPPAISPHVHLRVGGDVG